MKRAIKSPVEHGYYAETCCTIMSEPHRSILGSFHNARPSLSSRKVYLLLIHAMIVLHLYFSSHRSNLCAAVPKLCVRTSSKSNMRVLRMNNSQSFKVPWPSVLHRLLISYELLCFVKSSNLRKTSGR